MERFEDVFAAILRTDDKDTIARAVTAAMQSDLKARDIECRAVAMINAGLNEVRGDAHVSA